MTGFGGYHCGVPLPSHTVEAQVYSNWTSEDLSCSVQVQSLLLLCTYNCESEDACHEQTEPSARPTTPFFFLVSLLVIVDCLFLL